MQMPLYIGDEILVKLLLSVNHFIFFLVSLFDLINQRGILISFKKSRDLP